MDIGIDLGTTKVMVYRGDKGIVIHEPSVVAFNHKTNRVLAVGEEAYRMLGRTPDYITAVMPLEDGVISDHVMTEYMVKEFIKKACGNMMVKPRVILCVPSMTTDVESRAVIETAVAAGARKVFLIEEPIAAALGAGIDINKPLGSMIVDIGGGTTDCAVISLNGIVCSKSIKLAGNSFNREIVKYINHTYKILIGERSAERVKIECCDVYEPTGRTIVVKGRNLLSGLPQSLEVSDLEIQRAVRDLALEIVSTVRSVLEVTPPELIGDIYTNGIMLTGGGAQLSGLDRMIAENTGVRVNVAEEPDRCVAKGVGLAFKHLEALQDGFTHVSVYKYK